MREDMVLRSVYLRPSDDNTLRRLAFELKVSKNELIRHAIASQLKEWSAINDVNRLKAELEKAREAA